MQSPWKKPPPGGFCLPGMVHSNSQHYRHTQRVLKEVHTMSQHTGIAANIALGFGAIIALLLVLLGFAHTNVERLSTANGWDRYTLKVLLETRQISTSVPQLQSATRGSMLTGNDTLPTGIHAEETIHSIAVQQLC